MAIIGADSKETDNYCANPDCQQKYTSHILPHIVIMMWVSGKKVKARACAQAASAIYVAVYHLRISISF